MSDARFEDAEDGPVALVAQDPDDLKVISALVQDSVLTAADLKYSAKHREFALLLNRFRWEDRDAAAQAGRAFERVRCVLMFRDVLAVRSQGIAARDPGLVLSLLALEFAPGQDGMGVVTATLAGDGAIALEVEALNVSLRDVTRPYIAPSRKMPDHGV
tara:strand:+ start:860 stop:1336 length:477 start_codon:yes stop_codon:yes gene_type:complete